MQPPGLADRLGGPAGPLSEDCLYLNVWTPNASRDAHLPVIVWIHGGAYVFGSGAQPIYNGAPLAKKRTVVVTINYRLMQLGFFAHAALQKEAGGGTMNFGLLDQIAALKWVQQNIAAFGGDPKNITIFGESAGSKSVLAMFASPLARGLFQKGIASSSYIVPDHSRRKALEIGANVASALGLNGEKATIAQLRALPADRFATLKGQPLSNAPVPIWGDEVLPKSIENTFQTGQEAAVPLIIGSTSDDSSVIAGFGLDPEKLLQRLGPTARLLRVLYPGVTDEKELARQVARETVFTMPARWTADRHSKRAPTWRYYFDYVAVKQRPEFVNGVPHGLEIPYFLVTGDIADATKHIFAPADRAFSQTASDYVVQFARTGRPGSSTGPQWPNHRAGQDRTLVFADPIKVESDFMRQRLNILIGVGKLVDTILGSR
jgi:para-nitrobenzyl esterase